ncbi:BNR repeat-containing protein [Bythopirellula polymerisocia]|uniref:Uncharacterized protein n=1 Tax=Bythopirellula polymerisocia TaxID=2528003 RepID=A0A5C6CXM0_9BACT|nr:BNR repeat-containing protein [Bythopirellula polymerisocia]TWU28635.1 hypothetical protein Pla144_19270 [Bythopirellula polymerisocia]
MSNENLVVTRSGPLYLIRRLPASTMSFFIGLLICQSIPQATAQLSVSPLFDMSPDSNALVLATGGNFSTGINGRPFQQEALITHEGYQYASWYHNGANQDIYIARRDLSGNTWETIDTGFNMIHGNQNWDSHNVISMGISGDGRIHLSFDHHVDGLRYATTNTGVATSSGGVWNSSIFNSERNSLNVGGSTIPRVTYPRFTNVGDDLVFTYRDYGSGNGDHRIADYNSQTGQWSNTRFVTKGRSTNQTYDDVNNNPSNDRNSYHNGFHADSTGRLHTTWTWREGTQDGNHDIMYAYSDDKGVTWRNNADVQVGTNSSPITLNSPGIEVVDLDRRQALINQQGQIVDHEGGVHVLMYHRRQEPGFEWQPGDGTFFTGDSAYHHYYRDPLTGVWDVNRLPVDTPVGERPRIGVDSQGNLFGLYTQSDDLVIAGAEKITGGYADWEILYRDQTRNYTGTPLLDNKRLFDEGILSIFVQEEATSSHPTNPTGSPLHILEFRTVVPEPPTYGTLIAGWATWDSGATPTASVTAAGVTGSAVTTTEGLNWHTTDGRGASADGDWGTFAGPPTASTVAGDGVQNENLELPNATTGGTITFTITNNGTEDLELDGFHFNAYAFRPKAARAYELSVASGDISNGVIYTSADDEITHVAGAWDNYAHDDISHSLLGLADNTLEVGGSVDFLLAFSSGDGDGSGGHDLWIDNVAITAVVHLISGDFDNDGDVDGADFLEWQRNDGTLAGLAAWQNNYGAPSLLSASSATVPEPNNLLLMLIGIAFLRSRRQ